MNPLDNLLLTFEWLRTMLYFALLKLSAFLLISESLRKEIQTRLQTVQRVLFFRRQVLK